MVRVGYWCLKEWPKPLYSKLYETGMLLLILAYTLIILDRFISRLEWYELDTGA